MKAETLTDLLAWTPPPHQWLIDHLLGQESRLILWGAESSWKSFLSLHLAFCLATGRDWLGHKVVVGKVLLLHIGEVPKPEFRQRIIKYMQGNQITVGSVANNLHFLIEYDLRLDTDGGLAAVHSILTQVQPQLLVIDPLFKVMSGHLGDEYETKKFLATIDILRQRHHCAIWIVHHDRKPQQTPDGLPETGTQRLLGSRLLSAWADVMIHVETVGDSDIILYLDSEHGGKPRNFETIPQPIHCHINRDKLQFELLLKTDMRR